MSQVCMHVICEKDMCAKCSQDAAYIKGFTVVSFHEGIWSGEKYYLLRPVA